MSYVRALTICLLLVYFVSAAGCHCFDLLCQCHVTRQLWCSLSGWLQGVLRLPPLEPVTAMLGSWDLENEANVFLNHFMLLFKCFIYRFRNMNTSVNLCHLQHFIL